MTDHLSTLKRPIRRAALLTLLCVPSLFLAACADDPGIPIACAGDNHCPPPSNAISWAVQLAPNGTGSPADPRNQLMAQEFSRLSFTSDGSAQVRFRPTALVSGSVLDANATPQIGARVVARLNTLITGQNAYSLSTLTADSSPGTWTLRVPLAQDPSAQPYRFWVGFDDPTQASLSPPLWRDQVLTGDMDLPLRLRSAADLAVVTGRIVNALGEGVGNLTVQVLDPQNQIVSSTGTSQAGTGTAAGNYRITVDPALLADPSSPLKVVVQPGPSDPTLPILEATLAPPRTGVETRVDFAVPSHRDPVHIQLPIRGGPPGTSAVPIAGARVRAQVSLEDAATQKLGHRAYYIATADSDDQGVAHLLLVPAPIGSSNLIYQLSITSPSHTPYASVDAQDLQVGPNDGLLGAVTLPGRAQLRGRLLNAQGLPVAGAEVIATRITTEDPTPSPFNSMAVTADQPQSITDTDGTFSLRVDPGDYDLELLPLPGTDARTSLDNLRIQTDDVDLGDVHLPGITLGTIELRSPSNMLVPDTKVRVFAVPDSHPLPGQSCDGILPCSLTAKLRAEAFTDKDGRASFLLPAGNPWRTSSAQ